MSLKLLLASGIAALTLTFSAGAALAVPGVATATTTVRSGPGTSFRAVDRLFRGERVNIVRCRGAWCFVNKPGPDGWANSRFLSRSFRRPPVIVRPPAIVRPPFGYYRPPFFGPPSFGFGPPFFARPPFIGRPPFGRPPFGRPRPPRPFF
jgi:hypothetical protein